MSKRTKEAHKRRRHHRRAQRQGPQRRNSITRPRVAMQRMAAWSLNTSLSILYTATGLRSPCRPLSATQP